jgi:hypothetical protein
VLRCDFNLERSEDAGDVGEGDGGEMGGREEGCGETPFWRDEGSLLGFLPLGNGFVQGFLVRHRECLIESCDEVWGEVGEEKSLVELDIEMRGAEPRLFQVRGNDW